MLHYLLGTLHSDLKCCYKLRDFLRSKASNHEKTGGGDLASPYFRAQTPPPTHPLSSILPTPLNPHSCITINVMKQSLGVHVAAKQTAYSAPLMSPGTSPEFRKEPINLSVQLRVQEQ